MALGHEVRGQGSAIYRYPHGSLGRCLTLSHQVLAQVPLCRVNAHISCTKVIYRFALIAFHQYLAKPRFWEVIFRLGRFLLIKQKHME